MIRRMNDAPKCGQIEAKRHGFDAIPAVIGGNLGLRQAASPENPPKLTAPC